VTVPIHQVGGVDDAITSVTEPAVDAAVHRALQVAIGTDQNGATGTNLMLGARLYRERGPLPRDLAIAVVLELRSEGELVQSWPLFMHDSAFGEPVDWIRINMPSPGWNSDDPGDLAHWTVRVRGDPVVALGDFRRDRCWAGEFSCPLTQILGK